jgi:hypothetical protein
LGSFTHDGDRWGWCIGYEAGKHLRALVFMFFCAYCFMAVAGVAEGVCGAAYSTFGARWARGSRGLLRQASRVEEVFRGFLGESAGVVCHVDRGFHDMDFDMELTDQGLKPGHVCSNPVVVKDVSQGSAVVVGGNSIQGEQEGQVVYHCEDLPFLAYFKDVPID